MEFLKDIWAKIVIILMGALGVVLYLLNLKDKKLKAYKAKIRLADTKEKVYAIEEEIKEEVKLREQNSQQILDLTDNLQKLEQKKKQIADKEGRDVEEYWNNN